MTSAVQDRRSDAALARDLAAFECGAVDPAIFDHAAHVRIAFAMTGRYEFDEALARYARGLRSLCARVGKPEKYHATITVAFLALVGERRASGAGGREESWNAFAARNADLLRRDCLDRWYRHEIIDSDLARQTFLLPAPRP